MSEFKRSTSFCTKHQEEIRLTETDSGDINVILIAHYGGEEDAEIGIYITKEQALEIAEWIGVLK